MPPRYPLLTTPGPLWSHPIDSERRHIFETVYPCSDHSDFEYGQFALPDVWTGVLSRHTNGSLNDASTTRLHRGQYYLIRSSVHQGEIKCRYWAGQIWNSYHTLAPRSGSSELHINDRGAHNDLTRRRLGQSGRGSESREPLRQ